MTRMTVTPFRGQKVKGQGHQRRDRKSAISPKRVGLGTWNFEYDEPKTLRGDQPESFGWLFKSPLAGAGHIVAAPLQAAQPVMPPPQW